VPSVSTLAVKSSFLKCRHIVGRSFVVETGQMFFAALDVEYKIDRLCKFFLIHTQLDEELDGHSVRFGVRSLKLSNFGRS
jgi:hypothetical protein